MEVISSKVVDTEVYELTSELFESLVKRLSCVEVDSSKVIHTLRKSEYFGDN